MVRRIVFNVSNVTNETGFILSDVDKSGKKKNKQDLQTMLTKAVTKHCSSAKVCAVMNIMVHVYRECILSCALS